jgi:16S rRNA (cytidine1402-2'-O)-methyltransferase
MNNNSSLSHRREEPENGVLYLVGTPIGNLNDISPRALNILKNVSLIACEDTRQTKKITSHFAINNRLISFNKHNSLTKIPKIINFLKEGKSVALVSDAGMPSICDPGEDLVKNLNIHDLQIICIPGPSAALTALVSSGFPASKFNFEGFIPKKKKEREKILSEISMNEKTTIVFESPHRLKKLLNELKEHCGGQREISVSRELTKKFEEKINNNIDNVINIFKDREIKGEITIVIRGINKNKKEDFNKPHLKKEIMELIDAGLSLSAAAKYLAKKKNLKKNLLYNLH